MKALKYLLSTVLLIAVVWGCSKDEFDDIDFIETATAPANVAALFKITQDNTGLVSIIPTADASVSFDISYGDGTATSASIIAGKVATHTYSEGTYNVTVIANGITGLKTEYSKEIVVSFKAPEFGSEPIISNDAAKSKQVNVTVPDDAKYAMFFDVYFVEDGVETVISGNVGDAVSYTYANPGLVDIKVELKGGAIQTVFFTKTDFEVTEILQPITAAITPPNRAAIDVISIFSEKYEPTAIDMFVTEWSVLDLQEEIAIEDNQTLVYRELSYAGIITETSPIDASGMEYLHVDVWSTNVSTFKTKFVDFNGTGYNNNSDNIDFEVESTITEEGKWVSFDIPLADFVGVPFTDINQTVISADPAGTVFIDNMYFWREASVVVEKLMFDDFEGNGNIATWAEDASVMDTNFPNPYIDVNNGSATVLKYIDEGGDYANVKFDTATNFDLSVDNTFTLKIYVPSSSITGSQTNQISLKLQDGTANEPWAQQTEIIKTIALDTWQEITFDFANDVTAGAADPLSRTDFNRVVLQVNGEGNNDPVIAYIDDFSYGIVREVDTPPYATDNFEGNGTITTWSEDASVMDTNFPNPYIDVNNGSATVLKYIDEGGDYANVNFEVTPNFDLTAKSKFTLKIYVESSSITGSQPNQISLKLQDGTAGEPWAQQTEIIKTIALDTWQEITFDFANDVTAGAADPLSRTDFNRVVLQVNGEGNNDPVIAYIDDFNYHN